MDRLILFFQRKHFIQFTYMIMWLRSALIGSVWLIIVLCTFFLSPITVATFTLYEDWGSSEMTYCSFYARTKFQELTWLPETNELIQEHWILQWDAIVLIEQLLNNDSLVALQDNNTLSQKMSDPEPYTLLDFYVYTPSKQKELNRFDYQMQWHRALLLFLHDVWRIYDPVKITFPYRQTLDSYWEQKITPDMYPYVRSISYSVVEEVRPDVDALFVVPDIYEWVSHLKKVFSQDWFITTYDDAWMPISYRASQDLSIVWNDAITIFVWSWTEIKADDASPFSIDLLVFDEQWWLILPWKTLLFSKPILFLDATQEAYELTAFDHYTCTDPWVVIVPHTGTVSLGVCRSGLFGW